MRSQKIAFNQMHIMLILIIACMPQLVFSQQQKEKPTLYFSGIYSVSKDMPNYNLNRSAFLRKIKSALEKLSTNRESAFDLEFSTDAEKSKKLISDPLAISLLITRDDEQIQEYTTPCCGKFRKSDLNLGVNVIIYQKNLQENKSIVLFSLPINKYLTSLDSVKNKGKNETQTRMLRLLDSVMADAVKKLKSLDLEKIHSDVEVNGASVTLNKGIKDGIRANQSVKITCDDVVMKSRVKEVYDSKSIIKLTPSDIKRKACSAELYQVKMFDNSIWQITDVAVSSDAAKKMFNQKRISSQIATWTSDALVNKGLCVLPPMLDNQWVKNADQTLSMLLSHDGGNEEFIYPKPTNSIRVDLTGIAEDVIDENEINKQVGYKIWMSWYLNQIEQPEATFVSAINIVKDMEVVRPEDQFLDLIHSSALNLFKKEL